MHNLLQIFVRYGGFFLFLFLELICLVLILQYNQRQKVIWATSVNSFNGYVDEQIDNLKTHFTLSEIVDSLAKDNARYQEIIFNARLNEKEIPDSIDKGKYDLIPVKVINYSTNKNHNYLTLNKGALHGIKENSAVIDGNGIVGIVKKVKKKYSVAMSVLHRQMRISAGIKRNNRHGSLIWKDNRTDVMNLEFIPKHVDVQINDTIQTTGYSAMFPEGVIIGKVIKSDVPSGSNFYTIEVELQNDLNNLSYVYVINNLEREAQIDLEQEVINE